jgi:hypothetical protein
VTRDIIIIIMRATESTSSAPQGELAYAFNTNRNKRGGGGVV